MKLNGHLQAAGLAGLAGMGGMGVGAGVNVAGLAGIGEEVTMM